VSGGPTFHSVASEGRYHGFTTTINLASAQGWLGNGATQVRRELLPDITWIVKTGPAATDIQNVTLWCACVQATGPEDLNAAANCYGFRFRTPASDTTWHSITANGSNTITDKDTGVTVTQPTRYVLRAQWADINTLNFYVNGVLKTTHTSSDNIPTSTTG